MIRKAILFITTFLLIGGSAVFLSWLKTHQKLGQPGVRLDLPLEVLEYKSAPGVLSETETNDLPKDTTFARRYYYSMANGVTNSYFQLGFVLMGTDRTSIHNPQFCLAGQGWKIEKSEETVVPIARPVAYNLPVMRITSTAIQRVPQPNGTFKEVPIKSLYVYWFVDEDRLTASHRQRMWWMAEDLLTKGVLERWAYVSCFGGCFPGQEDALFKEMCRFLGAAVPNFQIPTVPSSPPSSPAALSQR